ncbi:phospholipase D-like domain-containing protein [Streptomyces sp. NPDC046332]|uniref:phospholipase D-like domain-containing protein n=1 Tax=Streptomyces sp. NPDC046332 TaxID=3155133 RepID=UPI0033DE9D31
MHSFSPDSLLAVRFHNARPGLELVTIIDAALPVALITADVLAQDSKSLPLMDEFVLRLVDHRVTSQRGISGMLGLPERMVDQTLAELFRSDDLRWAPPVPGGEPGNPRLRLTDKGRVTVEKAAAVEPVRVNQAVVYDQMLWKVAPYNRNTTMRLGQAEEDGLIMLPAARSGPVEDGDITAADITALLRENGTTDREVLQVKTISQAPSRRVLPVKILVYADEERSEIQLGVVVDGELSHAHELALIGHGGAKTLGITVAPPPERPVLEPDLEEARVPLQEVTQHRAEQAAFQLGAQNPTPAPPVAPEPQADEIRAIGVFEHPEILDEALTHARRRLLLISPWIKNAIITTSFLSKLEARLNRGVKVDIAYGYEENDTKTDQAAVRKLNNLAARYTGKFTFTRLKSTHAKILVYDDVWVTTSFNWLSFKGDPDRTYRMEEGSLVRNRKTADAQYTRYLELIDDQRR